MSVSKAIEFVNQMAGDAFKSLRGEIPYLSPKNPMAVYKSDHICHLLFRPSLR